MVSIWRIGGCGMIDPNKHGIYNKEDKMSDRWLIRIVWIGIPLISLILWYYIIKLIMYLINWGI